MDVVVTVAVVIVAVAVAAAAAAATTTAAIAVAAAAAVVVVAAVAFFYTFLFLFNQSGDARLVSPCPSRSPLHSNSPFAHLAAFSRGASQGQVRRFWRVVAKETMERLRRHPGRTTWYADLTDCL